MSFDYRALAKAALIATASLALAAMATGPEIKTAITGKTIHGNMDSSGPYAEYYTADGVVHGKDYKASGRLRATRCAGSTKAARRIAGTSNSPAIRFVG
jgi:hypothetical protein